MKKIILYLFIVISINIYSNNYPLGVPIKEKFRITLGFGENIEPFTGKKYFHRGIDLAFQRGTKVYATGNGIVEKIIENDKNRGNIIVILHEDNIKTSYLHLDTILINIGDNVTTDTVIGTIGSTGITTGPHLEYRIIYNNDYLDPEIFMSIKDNYFIENSINNLIDTIKSSKSYSSINAFKIQEKDFVFRIINKDFNFGDYLKNDYYDLDYTGIKLNENYQKNVNFISIDDERILTNRNIKIGDSVESVLNIYGKPKYIYSEVNRSENFLLSSINFNFIEQSYRISNIVYGLINAYDVDQTGVNLEFVIQNNIIKEIHIYEYVIVP